jgi:hypothetical protein
MDRKGPSRFSVRRIHRDAVLRGARRWFGPAAAAALCLQVCGCSSLSQPGRDTSNDYRAYSQRHDETWPAPAPPVDKDSGGTAWSSLFGWLAHLSH